MKFAFYPGCVARGAAPELYTSTMLVLDKLGIEVEEIEKAACTGAGVLQEKNQKCLEVAQLRLGLSHFDVALNRHGLDRSRW